MKRRRLLALVGTGTVGALAGCGGGSDATGESIEDHPAAADYREQPRLGDLGGHVVLAFEDPSCERCAAFHENTVPRIRSNLVDSGAGAYVVRTYPVVFPWGEPATQALEATYARDADAFWSLFEHYFATRSQFDVDNVLDRTASFLNAETSLDGDAVAADAREEAYDDAVQADIAAAEDAGLGETTPVVLLFRDGDFVTKVNGSVGYEVIAEALGEAD
ncbi:DsbA family protein [Halomicroarcula sp. F13]|uniref:DsbA family protein n=1 Tax=Haloarcula rubra TaxID=2487747 RepID=A0AAW4PRS8_9EURY|nr:thioredoxin domain-containing protein [Halomicroarcula rubra]MBX0323950.1 DsbA family protein [Halomicroarcula rubra]